MYNSPPPSQSTTQCKLVPATSATTLSPQPSTRPGQPVQNPNQPIQVFLVVYDLLPSGKLSDLAWLFGVGLYHTAVKIPTIGREIAFGGHAHPQASGIFSLPIPQDGQPSMPGLRWKCDIEMGYVKTMTAPPTCHSHHLTLRQQSSSFESSSHHRISHEDESGTLIRPPPSAVKLLNKYPSSSHEAYPPRSMMPETKTKSPIFHSRSHASSSSTISDSLTSFSSTTTSTPLETLTSILDQLDHSPDWYGTSYDLINRNCNAFSAHLCFLLTGKHAPNWINRAAAVGATLPCLVPAEWIEPPIPPAPPNESSGNYQDEDEECVNHSPYTPSKPYTSPPTTLNSISERKT